EAQLLELLQTVEDAPSAAAAADFRAGKLHGADAALLEADIAGLDIVGRPLLARPGFDRGRAGPPVEPQRCRVALGVAADQQYALALLGHHVGQVGEREGLADAAFPVDGDDLRFLLHLSVRRGVRLESGLHAKIFDQREQPALIRLYR